jgi:hypothetical protein
MFLTRWPRRWAPLIWEQGLRPSLVWCSLLGFLLCGVMAGTAQARVWVGFGFGVPLFLPPVVVGPPAYYPPYYYGPPAGYPPPGSTFSYSPPGSQPQSLAPPSGYGPPRGYSSQDGYAPSGGYAPSMGGGRTESVQSCQAGAYVCPLVQDTPPGGACSCPGHGGHMVRGQAD